MATNDYILQITHTGNLRDIVKKTIDKSGIPDEIKQSIEICDSGLKGKLNFPE